MPLANLPLFRPASENLDAISHLGQADYRHMNFYIDEAGSAVKRGGLSLHRYITRDYKIWGLYWWREKERLIIIGDQDVYSIDKNNALTNLGTMTTTAGNILTPTFASVKDAGVQKLLIANGGSIWETTDPDTASSLSEITGGSSPTAVTHLGYIDTYAVALDQASGTTNDKVYYSATGNPDTWNGDFFSAESEPDRLVAMSAGFGKIIAIGTKTLEMYYNDGTSPFSRINGATQYIGTNSPASLVRTDNGWIFLDDTKKVIQVSGTSLQNLSADIQKELSGIDFVNDAVSMYMEINGQSFYILTLPTAKRTFVYNTALKRWNEWSYYKLADMEHESFLGISYAFCDTWNQHFFGSRNFDGLVYEMSMDNYDDNGDDIVAYIQTGYIDHGMHNRKRSDRLSLRMKRGYIDDLTSEGSLILQWRNETEDAFRHERIIDLGEKSDTLFLSRIRKLGRYRARQYKFIISDSTPFVMLDAKEEFEVMAS